MLASGLYSRWRAGIFTTRPDFVRAPGSAFPPVASVVSLSRFPFVFTLFCASSFPSLAAMTLVVVVMSSEELSFEELTGAAVIAVVASRSCHLLRRSMEPPAVSTTYDLGSAHFSLTLPLDHVFDGLSMMRISCPGYNGGSAECRAVLLYDVVIVARRSSNRSRTPSSRFSFVCDGDTSPPPLQQQLGQRW